MSSRCLFLFAALSAAIASGCSSASADTSRDLVIRTTDFAFHAPDTVSAGITRLRLKNEGPEFHHVQLVKLDSGHTVRELLDALSKNQFALSWATFVGGPESPMPGGESEVTLDLDAGTYALICLISSQDHIRHLARGMVRQLTVIPSADAGESEPKADVRMVLKDYSFEITPDIKSGRHTIRVENAAAQPHHVAIVRLLPGKTEADAAQWNTTHQGAMPFQLVGGTTAIARGKVNFLTADFTPAEYILVCFIPDATDGRPHAAHGMTRTLTVE